MEGTCAVRIQGIIAIIVTRTALLGASLFLQAYLNKS
jgi:hypothetical protein